MCRLLSKIILLHICWLLIQVKVWKLERENTALLGLEDFPSNLVFTWYWWSLRMLPTLERYLLWLSYPAPMGIKRTSVTSNSKPSQWMASNIWWIADRSAIYQQMTAGDDVILTMGIMVDKIKMQACISSFTLSDILCERLIEHLTAIPVSRQFTKRNRAMPSQSLFRDDDILVLNIRFKVST